MNTNNINLEFLSNDVLHKWIESIFNERYDVDVKAKFINHYFYLTFSEDKKSITIKFTNNGRKNIFYEKSTFQIVTKEEIYKYTNVEIKNKNLLLYGVTNANSLISYENETIVINYDFISYMIWTLNRIEEYNSPTDDVHSRFQLKNSHLHQNNYYKRAIVDEWIDFLKKILEKAGIICKKNQFSFNVSHDVDKISRYISVPKIKFYKHLMVDIVKRPKLVLKYYTKNKDFFNSETSNTFDWLMDVSERFNIKSEFYFIPSNTSFKFDFRYNYTKFVKNIIKHIYNRGHVLGIHYSYNSSKKYKIKYEWNILNNLYNDLNIETIKGGRLHYLRINFLDTLRQIENVGQKYDNTLTFHETGGFRCGTCFPYKPFDIYQKRILNIEIRPLIVMEGSVLNYSKIKINNDCAFNYFKELIVECYKVGGNFSLLWHNDEFEKNENKNLYIKVLEYCDALKNSID